MTHDEALVGMGFNPAAWEIFTPAQYEKWKDHSEAKNNMVPVTFRNIVKELGPGHWIVNRKWSMGIIDKIEEGQEPKNPIPAPPVTEIPNPPDVVPEPPAPPSNVEIPEPEENIQVDEELPQTESFVCKQFQDTGEKCTDQCKLCEQAQENGVSPDEQAKANQQKVDQTKQKVEEIVEQSGIPQNNVVIATVPNVEVQATLTEQEKPMVQSPTQKGFFSELAGYGFQQLNISITKHDNDEDFTVIVKPNNFSGDSAYDVIPPLQIKGNMVELDLEFFNLIGKPLTEVHGLMSNAQTFIDSMKLKEAETKAKAAEKKKLEDLLKKADKFYDKDDFDYKKSAKTAIKKYSELVAIAPKSTEGKKAQEKIDLINNKLKELAKEDASKLDL